MLEQHQAREGLAESVYAAFMDLADRDMACLDQTTYCDVRLPSSRALLAALLPEGAPFRARTVEACAHLTRRQQLLVTAATHAREALAATTGTHTAGSSAARRETRQLQEFALPLQQLQGLEAEGPAQALGAFSAGLAKTEQVLVTLQREQQACLERLAQTDLAHAVSGETASGSGSTLPPLGAAGNSSGGGGLAAGLGGSSSGSSSGHATEAAEARILLDKALKAFEATKSKGRGMTQAILRARTKLVLKALEAADRVLAGRRRQETDFGSALTAVYDVQLSYHRNALEVLERLRPTRETAGDFIADARTELQQQRHKLQSIHSRLAEQLDRLQDGKSDVWQPRADAVHEAEIMASDIIGRAGNAACADCGAPATYARADLGLTLCARCAAQHKALLMERGGSETAGGELISATSAAAAVTSVATPTSAFVEAAAAALAAAPLGETPPQALLLALDAPPRLVPLPGLAVVSKATRSDLWPLAADLAFVRALGNTAANDVFEHALRGSGKARSFKPAPDGSDAERATYIRSKYIARQFVSPEGVSRSLVEAAAAGDMPSLLHHVFVNRSRQLEDKSAAALCVAAERGQVMAVLALLHHGADPNAVADDRSRPLHLAAAGGHADVAQVLLRFGADRHALNAEGQKPQELSPTGTPPIRCLVGQGDLNLITIDWQQLRPSIKMPRTPPAPAANAKPMLLTESGYVSTTEPESKMM